MKAGEREIDLALGLVLRRFETEDAPLVAKYVNDVEVAKNLSARIPHPYRYEDALFFIDHFATAPDTDVFAVVQDGEVIGSAGLDVLDDVHERTVEIGYWIGRPFFGRGIATRVVAAMTAHAFLAYPEMVRLQARVFSENFASIRVLEKNGFVLEATLRKAVTRFEVLRDEHYFVRFRDDAS